MKKVYCLKCNKQIDHIIATGKRETDSTIYFYENEDFDNGFDIDVKYDCCEIDEQSFTRIFICPECSGTLGSVDDDSTHIEDYTFDELLNELDIEVGDE